MITTTKREFMFEDRKTYWFELIRQLAPAIVTWQVPAVGTVRPVSDVAAFQGWRMDADLSAKDLSTISIRVGESLFINFKEHLVGTPVIQVALTSVDPIQIPIRLRIRTGEVAAEVCESPADYPAKLDGDWMAGEVVFAEPGIPIRLSKRRAFQFVRIDLLETEADAPHFASKAVGIRIISCFVEAQSSAGAQLPESPAWLHEDSLLRQIDEVGLRTLRNCMQGIFEDGPKRDRRLWLGDLRLQALANYSSFANYDLVKRCLYIFAACSYTDGIVPACVYEDPQWHGGTEFIPDYSLLYGPTLLDYALASDDWETAGDLWPVAQRQLDLIDRYADAHGLFVDPKTAWLFIDWNPELDRQTAIVGTMLYSLERTAELANRLGHTHEASELKHQRERLLQAARTHLFDPVNGLFVSGNSRQISWASQVWMILGNAVSANEAQAIMGRLSERSDAVMPITPYLYHHVVNAYLHCGLPERAELLLRSYWGEMIRLGATTFWEVFDPKHHKLSPYGTHLHNSYCHAWSCTPSYLLRAVLNSTPQRRNL